MAYRVWKFWSYAFAVTLGVTVVGAGYLMFEAPVVERPFVMNFSKSGRQPSSVATEWTARFDPEIFKHLPTEIEIEVPEAGRSLIWLEKLAQPGASGLMARGRFRSPKK